MYIRNFKINGTNKYQEALKNVAINMARFKSPRALLKTITRFIDRYVGLTHASILIYEHKKERYIFVDSRGNKRIPVSLVKLDTDNPLICWFNRKERRLNIPKNYISYDRVSDVLNNGGLKGVEEDVVKELVAIKKNMEILKAAICVPGYFKDELLGVLILGRKLNEEEFTHEEICFFQTLANDASTSIKMAEYKSNLLRSNVKLRAKVKEVEKLRKKEQETYYQIIMSLANKVDARDSYTSGHLEEVEKLGVMTAQELGIDLKRKKKDILIAALRLHDVGKIGIPDNILNKRGKLVGKEWQIMKEHVMKGVSILEPLSEFKDVARIVMHHHEYFDGKGYPYGLKGEEIPLESRVISVVDAFHAMVSERPYRKKYSFDYALRELKRCAGTQFDPRVVDAFLRAIKKKVGLKYAE